MEAEVFQSYGIPLSMVSSFKYLGRVIMTADDDLANGDFESEEGEEAVGTNFVDTGEVGRNRACLRTVLQGRGPSRPDIPVVDVSPDAPGCPDPWGIPLQGGTLSDRGKSAATSRWGVVIPPPPPPGGGYEKGRTGGYRDPHF